MDANPFLGVFLHAVGGLAAGSFYLPYKRVRGWSWESYWIVGGFFSWIVAPWIAASILNPNLLEILSEAPKVAVLKTYTMGVLWGIGGLTFGLSMRYLGLSLGYALALGLCAALGTLVPPIFEGKFLGLFQELSGVAVLSGVAICLGGIALCGWAGILKEKELSAEEKAATVQEFDFVKGVWVALFCGAMSSCMAFAFQAGEPIAALAEELNTPKLWRNTPILVVALLGGFTTNFIYCVFLNLKNKTGGDYLDFKKFPVIANAVFSALAGVTWYFQFFFYGMGTTKMGKYDFSSWTLHMAFIIIFSNLWGLFLLEWKGTGRKTRSLIFLGIAVLVVSTLVVGYGNYVKAVEAATETIFSTVQEG